MSSESTKALPGDAQRPQLLDLPTSVLATILSLAAESSSQMDRAASVVKLGLVCKDLHSASIEALTLVTKTRLIPRSPDPVSLCHTIQRFQGIQHLDLSGMSDCIRGDDLIAALVAGPCRDLSTLKLDYVRGVTGRGIETLGHARLPALADLSLSGCHEFTTLQPLCALPSLTALRLRWCHAIPEDALKFEGFRLQLLDLQGCECVGDGFIHPNPLASVTSLNLAYTAVTDRGLEALAQTARRLRRLTLAPELSNNFSSGRYTASGVASFQALNSALGYTVDIKYES